MQYDPDKTFFTADQHYLHRGIIPYCNRPYQDVNDMTRSLISNHNAVVPHDGVVFNVGDLTMVSPSHNERVKRNIINKLNGQQHLIIGNHDEWKVRTYINEAFVSVHSSFWFDYKKLTFVLAHDPSMYTVIQKTPNAIHLCGHIHDLFKHLLSEKRIINVGVDVWDYKPVSLTQIMSLLLLLRPDLL